MLKLKRIMNKVVKQGQSFLDKVTQLTGSYEHALAAAVLNNRSITDTPVIGEIFIMPSNINNKAIAFFNCLNEPATLATAQQVDAIENLGIGKMTIGSTFIIAP